MMPKLSFRSLLIIMSLILVSIQYCTTSKKYNDVEITRIDNSNEGLIISNLRVTRVNKTYAAKGTVQYTDDLSDDYEIETNIFHSPMGNNQFILTPFRFQKSPLCSLYEKMYTNFLASQVNTTDMPRPIKDQPACPLQKKGIYNVYGVTVDVSSLSHLLTVGLYKAEAIIYKTNSKDVSSKVAGYFKLF